MSVLEKLSSTQHRRDEIPNQELARELVRKKDKKGIQEIAENLWNSDRNIANDCIKVIYEIAEQSPQLVHQYAGDFIKLLNSRNNRMSWGAATSISAIAHLAADELFEYRKEIVRAVSNGSVITKDKGIAALAVIASRSNRYRKVILPFLLKHLRTCRSKDVPQHSEKSLVAIDQKASSRFIGVLKSRWSELTPPQQKRVALVIRKAELGRILS